jgi:DNA-binding CsgD family transcriptional regulator
MGSNVSLPMVGRTSARDVVGAAIRVVADGGGRVVLIEGEPGIGKTRLVQEALGLATAGGMRIALGYAIRLEAQVPYAAWVEALRHAARTEDLAVMLEPLGSDLSVLSAVVPEIGPGPGRRPAPRGGFDSATIIRSLRRAIEALATDRPLLLVIEDIQWLDPSSIDLLAIIASRPPARLALVVTARTAPLPAAVEGLRVALLTQRSVEHVALVPLPLDDANELVGTVAPELDGRIVARIVDRAGGNPFFLRELAATSSEEAIPETVAAALDERIRGASQDAIRALRLTAVAASSGEGVGLAIIEAASGLPATRFHAAIHALLDADVLAVTGESVAFRHALLAEAVTANLLHPERRALHRRIALAMDATWADWRTHADLAGRRARHWSDAGDPERALVASLDAAAATRHAHAPRESLRHLERALLDWELVDEGARPTSTSLVEVLELASDAAIAAGERRSITFVERAIALLDPEQDPERIATLYQRLWSHRWHFGEGLAAIESMQIAKALGQGAGGSTEASALATEARALMLDGRFSDAIGPATRAMRMAADSRDRTSFVGAAITLSVARGFLGEIESGVDQLLLARRDATEMADPLLLTRTHVNASDLLCLAGRFEEAADDALAGVGALRELGAFGYADVVATSRVRALVLLGRWTEAIEVLETHDAPEEGNAAVERSIHRADIALGRGRLDDAEAALSEGRRRSVGTTGRDYDSELSRLNVRLAVERRSLDEARKIADAALSRLSGSEAPYVLGPVVAARLLVASQSAGGPRSGTDVGMSDAIESALGRLRQHAGAAPLERAWLAEAEAELAALEGRATPEGWLEVAALWEQMNAVPHLLYPLRRAAEAILATGHRQAAAGPLRRATTIAEALDASIELARLQDLARRARLTDSRPAALAVAGIPEPITARELEVLELLAAGNTNREIGDRLFISEHTVAAHVSHLLGKIGARSRADVVAKAARLGLLTPQPNVDPERRSGARRAPTDYPEETNR